MLNEDLTNNELVINLEEDKEWDTSWSKWDRLSLHADAPSELSKSIKEREGPVKVTLDEPREFASSENAHKSQRPTMQLTFYIDDGFESSKLFLCFQPKLYVYHGQRIKIGSTDPSII